MHKLTNRYLSLYTHMMHYTFTVTVSLSFVYRFISNANKTAFICFGIAFVNLRFHCISCSLHSAISKSYRVMCHSIHENTPKKKWLCPFMRLT